MIRPDGDAGMAFFYLVPVILSLLALAAHWLRSGNLVLVAVVLLLILVVLAARRPWVPRLAQAALAVGTVEWVRALVAFASERMRQAQPYTRLVVILGSVTLVTALSALVFES